MSSITIEIPWLLATVLGIILLCGVVAIVIKTIEAIRIIRLLWIGARKPSETERQARTNRFLTQADHDAQAMLDRKIRSAWRSLSSVPWTDPRKLRDDCQTLVCEIASAYYPKSKNPALEVTVLDLLKMNQRISKEVYSLISAFPTVNQLSVASILEAKALFDKTKDIVDKKGIRSGGRFAKRAWMGLNFLNPNYWINKLFLKGASEAVGRKLVTSIYRIVGTEAMQVYRASSAVHLDTSQPVFDRETESEECEMEQEEPMDQKANNINDEVIEPIIVDETDDDGDESSQDDSSDSQSTRTSSIAQVLSKFIEGSMQTWDKLVNPEKVFEAFRKQGYIVDSLADIRTLSIEAVDPIAETYVNKGQWLSALEGAATGFGGILLLSADAVSLLALQLRTIQQIGYCYGFDVSKPEEKLFTAKLLAEAYQHPARGDRASMLKEMRTAAGLLKGKTPFGLLQKRLFVQGFSKIAQKIGIRMGSRKVAQFLPVIGSIAGGVINKKVTKDIAMIAQEVYRDRFLELKKDTTSS